MISSAQSVTQPAPSVVCVVSQCCGFCGTCSAACGTTNPLPWTTLGAQLPRHRGTTSPNCPGSASNARPSAALPVDGRRWPDARRGAHPAIGIPRALEITARPFPPTRRLAQLPANHTARFHDSSTDSSTARTLEIRSAPRSSQGDGFRNCPGVVPGTVFLACRTGDENAVRSCW